MTTKRNMWADETDLDAKAAWEGEGRHRGATLISKQFLLEKPLKTENISNLQ